MEEHNFFLCLLWKKNNFQANIRQMHAIQKKCWELLGTFLHLYFSTGGLRPNSGSPAVTLDRQNISFQICDSQITKS